MFKRVILIFSFIFTLIGCGGGGYNGAPKDTATDLPSSPAESSKADISYYNSKKIALASYNATGIAKDGNYGDMFYKRKISDSQKILKALSKEAKALSSRAIAYDKKEYCEDGGSYTSTILSSNETEVNYNNCKIDGEIYDGNAVVKKLNSNYVTVTFKDFKIQNSNEQLTITKAIFKIDGTTSTVKIENMYAIDKKDGKTTTYLNYNTSYISDQNANRGTLTFNGWIKNDCTNGYVYVNSTNEIGFDFNTGFISGSMQVSSKGDRVTLSFEDDTLRIYDTNGRLEVIDISNLQYEIEQACN